MPPFHSLFGRPFVKRFALCYQTAVCLSVYDVGVLWSNSWTDQDEAWHAGRPWPRPHCVRWSTRSPPQKGPEPLPQFSAHVCCGPMAEWIKMSLGMEVGLGPSDFVLDGELGTQLLSLKRGQSPQFSADVYCGQTAACIKMPHGMEVGPGDFMLDGDAAPPPQKEGRASPQFSADVYCGQQTRYRDGAGNTVEENSSVFSLI